MITIAGRDLHERRRGHATARQVPFVTDFGSSMLMDVMGWQVRGGQVRELGG
jgi:hypothetical protein